MSLSIFGGKDIMPNEEMLAGVLTDSKALWDSIKNHLTATCSNISEQWKYYSKKAGWSLVIKNGERTILYLIPLNNGFKANFVFGEKAVVIAQTAGLPERIVSLICEAKPYMEGRSFMVDIKTEADVCTAIKLIEIKVGN